MGKLIGIEIDNRLEIAPDCFSSRELPEGGDCLPLMREIGECWKDQVEWGRWTIVSPEYPNAPYPDGLYFEGWSVAPHHHSPPGKEAPFNYPLTAEPARSQSTPDILRSEKPGAKPNGYGHSILRPASVSSKPSPIWPLLRKRRTNRPAAVSNMTSTDAM